jgi:hypothetical protein
MLAQFCRNRHTMMSERYWAIFMSFLLYGHVLNLSINYLCVALKEKFT